MELNRSIGSASLLQLSSSNFFPRTSLAKKFLCYCWTASLDGTIWHWGFSGHELLKTIDTQLPIYSMDMDMIVKPYSEVTRLGKVDFPRFNADKIKDWIFKVEQFFELDHTPEDIMVV